MPAADRLVPNDDWEREDIVRTFGGKPWSELDADTLEPEKAALSFFTPEAFRYYLPAFILGCLEGLPPGRRRYGRDIRESVRFSLSPDKKAPFLDRFHEIVRGLTPQQRAAIVQFLEYEQARSPDPRTAYALRTYWAP